MMNRIKATLAHARSRIHKLSAPPLPLPSPKPVVSARRFPEEPDYYGPGGFHRVSLGDTFDSARYTILRKIGYGQYSTVWLARDLKCQRYVAVKLLRADCYGTPHHIFEREILARISDVSRTSSHPGCRHLLPCREQFSHRGPNGDHVGLVFDVLGHHLSFQAAKYKDGRLPVKAVKEIARQLLRGLDFLHGECGVIHTDLKPTNILLELETPDETISQYLESVPPRTTNDHNGAVVPLREVITTPLVSEVALLHVRIIDFGVYRIQSPALRAPEVTLGAPWDTGVDIWSLGCLIVEFVQGIILFSGNASKNGTWTAEDDQLARMVEILGQFPPGLLSQGRRSAEFFDAKGIIPCIPSHGALFRIPNMKATSLERLLNGQVKLFIRPADMPETEIGTFIDFIQGMLEIDPTVRKSAAELLQHGWLS
ncbi:protein kinase, putative [Cordyceps militaris CM01]|uniref:non-specific serine/threonine protein kinase n=1 Tax=Cordyceps militaris (strain CM01) TaxID=983644 RepID=G3JTJ9_CORMM|nr:protein kinase, putative [Cordyceps militaris CM01]EGX88003.1 protein kinase, putative [Cordyceps militaris CM01]